MCGERIKNLQSIEDFNFRLEPEIKRQSWDEMFEELKLFKTKHGHTNVPTKNADNPKLGNWIMTQRQQYKNFKAGNKQKNRAMCEKRINKLESIDFNWARYWLGTSATTTESTTG